MLRFFSRFQADFQLTSGWIEPLLVGGHAPFSPPGSSPGWSTLKISNLEEIQVADFSFCENNAKTIGLSSTPFSARFCNLLRLRKHMSSTIVDLCSLSLFYRDNLP